jgi:hypothetical protein
MKLDITSDNLVLLATFNDILSKCTKEKFIASNSPGICNYASYTLRQSDYQRSKYLKVDGSSYGLTGFLDPVLKEVKAEYNVILDAYVDEPYVWTEPRIVFAKKAKMFIFKHMLRVSNGLTLQHWENMLNELLDRNSLNGTYGICGYLYSNELHTNVIYRKTDSWYLANNFYELFVVPVLSAFSTQCGSYIDEKGVFSEVRRNFIIDIALPELKKQREHLTDSILNASDSECESHWTFDTIVSNILEY